MKDREFLIWLHERLEHVHKEHHLLDYMHKFRAVISAIPENQETNSYLGKNSLEELIKEFK